MNTKYQSLEEFLKTQSSPQISMSFDDIERVLKFELPPSARKHRPWWSNNPRNSVMTKAWLRAGYRTAQVDMEKERLVFCRERTPDGVADNPAGALYGNPPGASRTRTFYGCMEGMVTITEGYDLTDPADPQWRLHHDKP